MSAAFIGLDLAKSVFQVHGVDVHGKVVVTKRLRRDAVLAFFANLAPCVVGMEACAGSHFWAREIARLGHTVRLMAPQYVKPYVKRQKNDRADAEAICEAVQRPSMRFVAVKSEEQQSTLAIHRVRETLVGQKTQLINALRAHLAEFGIVAPQGAGKVSQLTAVVADLEDTRVPALTRSVLQGLVDQLRDTERRVEDLDARLAKQARENKVCQRLTTIPGIGPITATALVATVGDATVFESGRHLGEQQKPWEMHRRRSRRHVGLIREPWVLLAITCLLSPPRLSSLLRFLLLSRRRLTRRLTRKRTEKPNHALNSSANLVVLQHHPFGKLRSIR